MINKKKKDKSINFSLPPKTSLNDINLNHYTLDGSSPDIFNFNRKFKTKTKNQPGAKKKKKVRIENKLSELESVYLNLPPKSSLNEINLNYYTLDGSAQGLFEMERKLTKKLQNKLNADKKKCTRIEEEFSSDFEGSKQSYNDSPLFTKKKSKDKEKMKEKEKEKDKENNTAATFKRKNDRHKSYICESPKLFKKILANKLKKNKKSKSDEDTSTDNSLSLIQNNEALFSRLYSKNKFNQTQVLNEINLKLTQNLSNTLDFPIDKKNIINPKKKISGPIRKKSSNSFAGKTKKIKDDNDIRNFIPLTGENYKKFETICDSIKDSLIMMPEKTETKKNTINPANVLSMEDISDINHNVNSNRSSSSVIKKIESLKEFKNDDNQTLEDTQSQKYNRELIKEIKYRCLTKQNKLVYDSLSDEEMDEELSGTFYIEPNCTFKFYYDMLITFFSIYSVIYTPYLMCFDIYKHSSFSSWYSILDVIIDIFFLFDVFLGFFTAYYDFEEQLITRLHPIAMNYLTGWFFCDLLSGFPFNSLFILTSSKSSSFVRTYISDELKLLDLLKILRVLKLFKVFLLNFFTFTMFKFCLNIDVLARWVRLYFSLIIFFFSVHLLSCVFIFLGQLDYPNWIYTQGFEMKQHLPIYITSFYYICATVFTIGYGDVTSISTYERVFNLLLLVVGIMIYSWSVTSLSNYVQSVDSKTLDYQKKVAILEQIRVTHEKMPSALYDKISRFLLYKLHNEKKDKNDIVDNLPIGLRNKLIIEMYRGIINKFIFFKNFDNTDFIIKVILAFKPIQATKNERLVNEGDYIQEIIFVKRGSLALEVPLPVVIKDETLQSIQSLRKTKTSFGNYTFNKTFTSSMNHKLSFAQNPDTIECNDEEDLGLKKTLSKTKTKKNNMSPYPEIKPVKQYIKIIEIRSNEHFGDILMFLNKRSPLSVKVKSRVAEIFLLRKTDAVEISMSFPRIWRKIIKKSLFNMEQIERLINKSLKFFFIHNEGVLRKGSISKSNYYHRDFTKKNTYLNSKKLLNSLTRNDTACELQSIPSEIEDEEDETLSSEYVDEENGGNGSGEEGEIGESSNNENNEEEEEGEEDDSEGNKGNNYEIIQEENSEECADDNNSTLKDNQVDHDHNNEFKSINSDKASSDTSFAKTIKTNIDNNYSECMISSHSSGEEESDFNNKMSKNPFGSTQGDLIDTNTLPYSAEEINKEKFPFEASIDLKDNSFIPSIYPNTTNNSSTNSHNNNTNLIHNQSNDGYNNDNNDLSNNDFSFPLKKTYGLNMKKISSFNMIGIGNSFGFSLYGTNAIKSSNVTNNRNYLKKSLSISKATSRSERTNKNLKKSKSVSHPQNMKDKCDSPIDKRKNSKTASYQKKDMYLKGETDQNSKVEDEVSKNREVTENDEGNENKTLLNNGKGLVNAMFGMGNINQLSPTKKQSNSNSMLDMISQNIEKNYLNLNNPKYFYSNYFSKVMNKDDPKDNTKTVVQKLKDIATLIEEPNKKMHNSNNLLSNIQQ